MANSVLSAAHFQDEEAAFAFVEARLWPNGPVCPHCGTIGDKIGKLNGETTRAGLRKCYACRKAFTVRMGTIFESSHLPLRYWLQAMHLLCASKKGISTRQIQRMFKCSMKTAWHLTHRIRFAIEHAHLRQSEVDPLSTVESASEGANDVSGMSLIARRRLAVYEVKSCPANQHPSVRPSPGLSARRRTRRSTSAS
jgi:transposase-like protein